MQFLQSYKHDLYVKIGENDLHFIDIHRKLNKRKKMRNDEKNDRILEINCTDTDIYIHRTKS